MINIIPEAARSSAVREYRIRLVALCAIIVAVLCVCAVLMLMPAYLFATVAKENAADEEARLAQAESTRSLSEGAVLVRSVEETKLLLAHLTASHKSDLLLAILAASEGGVSITRISYADGEAAIQLSGTATTRDALLSFSRKLKQIPEVSSADVPVSDLAKSTDVRFTMTAVLKK